MAHLTYNEYPNSNIGTLILDEDVGDEATKDGSQRATNQGNPGHKVGDLLVAQTLCLKEQLSVVRPHIATGIPYSSSDTKHEHAKVEECLDDEKEMSKEAQLVFFHFLVSLEILGTLWLPDREENQE